MIHYTASTGTIKPEHLQGFFVGWPNPPTPQTHLHLLQNSDEVILAIDGATNQVVGFISAHTDKILTASISLLEVLPAYQGQGIGRALVGRMLEKLNPLYAIDLICDPELQPFYAQLGMRPAAAMMVRNYPRQAGTNTR